MKINYNLLSYVIGLVCFVGGFVIYLGAHNNAGLTIAILSYIHLRLQYQDVLLEQLLKKDDKNENK